MREVIDLSAYRAARGAPEERVRKPDIAKRFGVSERTIERWMKMEPPFPHRRVVGVVMFPPGECSEWVDRQSELAQQKGFRSAVSGVSFLGWLGFGGGEASGAVCAACAAVKGFVASGATAQLATGMVAATVVAGGVAVGAPVPNPDPPRQSTPTQIVEAPMPRSAGRAEGAVTPGPTVRRPAGLGARSAELPPTTPPGPESPGPAPASPTSPVQVGGLPSEEKELTPEAAPPASAAPPLAQEAVDEPAGLEVAAVPADTPEPPPPAAEPAPAAEPVPTPVPVEPLAEEPCPELPAGPPLLEVAEGLLRGVWWGGELAYVLDGEAAVVGCFPAVEPSEEQLVAALSGWIVGMQPLLP